MINKDIKIKLESNLKIFNLSQLQDFKTVTKILIKLNISLQQYIEFVETKIDNIVISRPVIRKCSNCGQILRLMPVNFSKSTQTGDNSKSVWFCPNCLLEKYSPKTVQEIMRGIDYDNRS